MFFFFRQRLIYRINQTFGIQFVNIIVQYKLLYYTFILIYAQV